MKFKKTSIAFSALCGILCLMLIALWVRSYWRMDAILRATLQSNYYLRSDGGFLVIAANQRHREPQGWSYESGVPAFAGGGGGYGRPSIRKPHLSYENSTLGGFTTLYLPLWIGVMSISLVGFAPWLFALPWSKRFSLRTLLIATTAVAVSLWFIVWMARE
jgi:hypothetical protein